jgi:metallo-beta-lactamase class B
MAFAIGGMRSGRWIASFFTLAAILPLFTGAALLLMAISCAGAVSATAPQDISSPPAGSRQSDDEEDSSPANGEPTQPVAIKINDWSWLSDVEARRRTPFHIFDNVSYVGLDWVSCYLIETDAGLILIDSLYQPFMEILLDNIRALGHDPQDVAYVVVTHGHWDHAGGARFLQQRLGARVVLSGAGWDLMAGDSSSGNTRFTPADEDLVLDDGESLTLGDTTLAFHLTPGHTAGSLSVEFPARDGDTTWRALTYGGVGINFDDPHRLHTYMDSVHRIQARGPFQVNLTNHPGMGRVFPRSRELAAREPGQAHPYVDPAGMSAWLESRLAAARKALPEAEKP